MNLETKITIYKFTPQVFTLTPDYVKNRRYTKRPNLFCIPIVSEETIKLVIH